MNSNQAFHLLQWSFYIIIIIVVLLFIPARYVWIALVFTGMAFTSAFILRLMKKYPGEDEPLYIDLLTGAISVLLIIPYRFIEGTVPVIMFKIITPFIILVPHFVFIIKNRSIHPPGIIILLRKIRKKS